MFDKSRLFPADRAQGEAFSLELAHSLVARLTPTTALRAFRQGLCLRQRLGCRLLRADSFRLVLWRRARRPSVCRLAKLVRAACQQTFPHISPVLEKMPPVGNLNGLGRSAGGSFDIGVAPVPADNLHASVERKPGRERVRFWVRQQLHGAMPIQVHQDRAIDMALLEGDVIHTEAARGRDSGKWNP